MQEAMVAKLNAEERNRIRQALVTVEALDAGNDEYSCGHMSLTTGCSGTDIARATLQGLLSSYVRNGAACGHMRVETLWCCEVAETAIQFLQEVMETEIIFADVNEIHNDTAEAHVFMRGESRGVSMTKTHPGDFFIAGFSCRDVSMYNVRRDAFSDCIASSNGTPGTTFAGSFKHVLAHGPVFIVLENVKGLRGRNIQMVVAMLREAGYLVTVITVNCNNHGLQQRRARVDIVGVLTMTSQYLAIEERVQHESEEMEIVLRQPPLPMQDFLLP